MSSRSPARLPSTTAASPSSSPRLPSPPPLPELQLGPKSPLVQAVESEQRIIDGYAIPDEGAHRRVRPGTSAADMAKGPPFVPLHQVESPFQLQEYLKSLYCSLTHDVESSTIKPITRDTAIQMAAPPIQQDTNEPVDKQLWLYELCRFLVQRTNRVIVSCFNDNPPCSSQTCPEMRASEWQYLCAVHEPPKSCCAIDYCCHTLDWAANVLTSTKHFPSRLSLGGEGATAYQSMRQLTNIFRRVYRIYAHTWFQHREVFWSVEQEEGLYKFYKTVCEYYSLISDDNYTVPPEAEGEREDSDEADARHDLDPEMYNNVDSNDDTQMHIGDESGQQPPTAQPSTPQTMPQTQRRHRHTPSTGTQVTSITESEEEEEEDSARPPRLQHTDTQIPSAPPHQARSRASPPAHSTPLAMTLPVFETNGSMKPEDPTPKPESHGADPFDDSVKTILAGSAAEGPAADTMSAKADNQPNTRTTVRPFDSSPTASSSRTNDDTVLSPGGGSIRTVSDDILSGILAHIDLEEDATTDKDSTLPQHRASAPTEHEVKAAPLLHNRDTAPLADPKEPAPNINLEIRRELANVREANTQAAADQHSDSGDGVGNREAPEQDVQGRQDHRKETTTASDEKDDDDDNDSNNEVMEVIQLVQSPAEIKSKSKSKNKGKDDDENQTTAETGKESNVTAAANTSSRQKSIDSAVVGGKSEEKKSEREILEEGALAAETVM